MVRIFFTYILPLALPTLMYFAWVAWVRKKVQAKRTKAQAEGVEHVDGDDPADYDIKTPWLRLILAGIGLTAVGLVLTMVVFGQNEPGSVYQPPYVKEDGTIVPGQYVAPKTE